MTKTKKDKSAADTVFAALAFQYKPLEASMLAELDDKCRALYAACSTVRKIAILDRYAGRLGL